MRPNIVFFMPDQFRADALHHLGNEASYTPNMDALANEGVSFSDCYCQNPVCTPSRCSLMTGQYPHVHGHRTMNHLLRSHETNLLKTLKENGYYVAMSGRGDLLAGQDKEYERKCVDKIFYAAPKPNFTPPARPGKGEEGYFSFLRGTYETTDGKDGNTMDVCFVDQSIDFIRNYKSEKPFMLFTAINDPHPPYMVEKKYYDLIDKTKLPKRYSTISDSDGKPSMETGLRDSLGVADWSDEKIDEIRAVYLGMCAKTDALLGRLIDELKAKGIYDNTAIFVFADHGDYTGDFGLVEKAQNCFPDCLVNVPLIVKPPKGVKVESGVNTNLVELLDIYATALEYAQASSPHTHSSRSLSPMIADKSVENREFVCCEGGRRHDEEQARETVFGLAENEYEPRITLQWSEGPEHTKATMLRTKEYKYIRRLYEQDEFYDLSLGESRNLIEEPKYAQQIAEMRDQMLTWYQESCDVVPRDEDERFGDGFLLARMPFMGRMVIKSIMRTKKCSVMQAAAILMKKRNTKH